jgi:hypothetical protein
MAFHEDGDFAIGVIQIATEREGSGAILSMGKYGKQKM